MWSCKHILFSGEGWDFFFPGCIWSLMIWSMIILLLACIVIRIFKSRKRLYSRYSLDCIDSLSILKARFARGEISEEEFLKSKEILSKP